MSDTSLMRYRVYCSEQEATTFPMDVLVEASYPAFCIISATAAASVALRQQYPVELLGDPSPPPVTPAVAGADQAVAKTQNRPPYLQVIRFQSPVRAEELQYVEATGCQLLTPIGSSTFVVRCPTKESLTQLKQLAGLAYVRDYVPEIQLNPDSFTGLNNTPALATIEAASASDSPAFKRSSANLALPGALVVSFFTGEDKTRAKRSLRRKKIGKLTDVGATTLVVDLSDSSQIANDLQAIITQPGLRSLQEQKLNRPFNNIARRLIAERVITDNPHGLGLTGHGEIVAVADSGLDTGDTNTIHLDFRGRVKHIRSFPIKPSASSQVQNPGADDGAADIYSGHGTHVAGSILGNGAKAKSLGVPEIQGVAPEATLVFQAIEQTAQWQSWYINWHIAKYGKAPEPGAFIGIPDNLQELFQPAYDQGARIHSDSWGGGDPGVYDQQCLDLDHFVWMHKDFLVVVAAGNDGVDISPPGSGIDAMSVTSPAVAKNCLTVGATENARPEFTTQQFGVWWPKDFPHAPFKTDPMSDSADDIVPFSSRGPCKSVSFGKPGRRKPDVMAPGSFILSTRSSQIPANHFSWGAFPPAKHDYMFMGGTSMATPLVAGCAAIVRQYLRQVKQIANPSAALLKATLIHSAHYLNYRYKRPDSTPWADNEQGWGRVDLQQVLNPLTPTQVLFVDNNVGLAVGQANDYLLTLTDPTVPLRITLVYTDFPSPKLVNDLNVMAYEPNGGRFYLGNDFSDAGIPDAINNVEGIRIANPKMGQWRIQVVAADVPRGPQDYALVISGGGISFG